MERPTRYFLYHLHSDYSFLDSCTDFGDYIDLVKRDGGTAIASTEHGLPRGWVSKKLQCDKAGLKFVHGVEIYLTEQLEPKVRDNYHTVLLAKNAEGLKELNSLVTISSDDAHFYYVNRLSFEEFLGISDNIIKTSACLASPLNKLDESDPWFEKLLRHYDYLEVQPHNHPDQISFNKRLAAYSKKYGIPLVAGTDTHSSSPYKAECRSILMAAKHKSYGDEDAFDLTYKTVDELIEAFRVQGALTQEEYYEAIENTNRIADACEDFSLDTSIKYPILHGSKEDDESIFVQRVWESLDDKLEKGIIPREQETAFRDALQEELRVFKKLGMSGFMLSMSDLVRWCKSEGMAIGAARGSVGGSRAAYVTDIIDLNPEQWHTVFSRFANEDRVEIGDIDVDVVYDDRPRIFNYITDRFGADKTARVAAYGTLADKSVIDEVCRALESRSNDKKHSIEISAKIKKEYSLNPEQARKHFPEVFYYYDGLVGTRVSQSVHPAGMVISPITLNDNYGTFVKDGETCLLLDMDEAHEVGAAKYDFLALKTVKVIRDTCNYIGIPYPRTHEVNWNDQAVWADMIRIPYSVFQFEGDFAFQLLKKFQPHSIFDMSLVTACIRPSGASYRNDLIAHKPHKNPSPMIDELLKDNLGYLVYQEDIIKFLQEICGLSGSTSDSVRRGIAKKKMDILEQYMPAILEGYCANSDKPKAEAEQEAREFLQVIEDASSYMFNYSHSVAYCLMGYLCAYYRYYYPMEFATAFLNNAQNDDDIANGTRLMRAYGIRMSNPKWGVSRADYFFDKENKVIYKGLGSIKFMGVEPAEDLYKLAQSRNYKYFIDLLYDLTHETRIDSRQIDLLIKIDFFSEFGNQRELLRLVDMFALFKKGEAKQLKKSAVDGTAIAEIVKRYAVGVTKSGGEAKSYTLLDVMSILRDIEDLVKSVGMDDLSDTLKVQNFSSIMGSGSYISGREEDRPKLIVSKMFPACRKRDGKQFGYNVYTRSIGSGKESCFTIFNNVYDREPVKEGDLIYCKSYDRDKSGKYFTMTSYSRIV